MINRRYFLKQTALISTIPTLNLFANNISPEKKSEKINKITFFDSSICPLCSIGCRTILKKEIHDNTITINEIIGDIHSPINQGELCHKITQLPYEYDINFPRLETPLLKMKDGKYSKDGVLSPISWENAFTIMEQKSKKAMQENGINGIGLVTSESLSLYESYAVSKLFKAGFRSNNIANINYEVERNSLSLIQTFGIDGSNGTFNDIFESNYFVSYGINFNTDFQIVYSKLRQHKSRKNNNFTFINVITNEQQRAEDADINFLIQPDSETLLLHFLINQSLQVSKKKDFDLSKNKIIFAAINQNVQINDDKFLQWEISYHNYKKYFEKFTLEYVIDKIKIPDEDISQFKFKLSFLLLAYTKKHSQTLSYFDSKKDSQSININLLVHSLHLLSHKYGKSGCGIFYLHSSKLTSTTSLNHGMSSHRLPCGMFTKYKQHRERAEAIWKIPTNTLNSLGSENFFSTFKKFNDKTTQFLWVMGCTNNELEPYYDYLKDVDDSFIVYSNTYYDDFVLQADLILPTTTLFEKHIGFENSQREISLSKQQLIPYGESMSELWQILEFSKKFTIQDCWGNSKITKKIGLKNILNDLDNFDYNSKSSLFTVLFNNNTSSKYKLNSEDFFNTRYLNTEVKGDCRTIFGGNGKLFDGYKFFIQKYLFEELRMFGLGHGYDFASFLEYSSNFYKKWPIISSKETKYRFSSSDDTYVKRLLDDNEFFFYGKLGGKQLPFGDTKNIINTNLKELKYRAKIFMVKEV